MSLRSISRLFFREETPPIILNYDSFSMYQPSYTDEDEPCLAYIYIGLARELF